jgi:hypothetical protein
MASSYKYELFSFNFLNVYIFLISNKILRKKNYEYETLCVHVYVLLLSVSAYSKDVVQFIAFM